MILANARLPEGRLADVEIADGLIVATHAPGTAAASNETIDLDGLLLLPAFVDGHLHLDKTHWDAPRLPHVEGRSVRERIAAERIQRHQVALPIEARASALVRTLIMNGATRARSHVDIDNDVGLDNLEAVIRVREAFRDWIDIQLVAFPQSGVTSETGAPDLMAAALMAGVTDEGSPMLVRAEAAYSLGKIRPTPLGVADFLLERITLGTAPAIVTSTLAALLQLDPPVDDQLVAWTTRAAALDAVCREVDRQAEAQVETREAPRARKYLEALIARWRATSS